MAAVVSAALGVGRASGSPAVVTVAPWAPPQEPDRSGSRRASLVAAIAVLVLGVAVAVTAITASIRPGGTFGQWSVAVGIVSGLIGTYLCLVLLLMVARIPFVERTVGQDRLVAYHRRLAPWAVGLIVLHVVALVIGYAQTNQTSWWSQLGDFVLTYPWMMPAAAAFAAFIILSLSSIRAIRKVLRYETWWVAHTYFYLAVALSVGHQLVDGRLFTEAPLLRVAWIALFVVTAIAVLTGRLLLPIWVSFRHKLRVTSCVRETDGVVSVYFTGRHLDSFKVRGGQFFEWRFLTRQWWWQAHPYSLSASPDGRMLRITVKNLGDQSASIPMLAPGTRVAVEGPYGVFTTRPDQQSHVTCFAAGCGIAPIRGLLDEFPADTQVTLLYRVSGVITDEVLLRGELEAVFSARPAWKLIYLPGSRRDYVFTAEALTRMVPHLADSDVYVCGADELGEHIEAACRQAGTPKHRIHRELFVF
ncbi:MAG: ferredoxin reductase family protein [Actinomycetes bacterium]